MTAAATLRGRLPAALIRSAMAHEETREWLEHLEERALSVSARWNLRIEEILDARYSLVLRVGGGPAGAGILKLIQPDDYSMLEAPGLAAYAGVSAPRLLERDDANGALLMELVTPGSALRLDEVGEDEAIRVIAEVLSRLWATPPSALSPPRRLTEWAAFRPEAMRRRHRAAGERLPSPLVWQAVDIMEAWDEPSSPVVLHGDLHFDNVVASDRCGWAAIDPKSMLGHREADLAALLRNPWRATTDIAVLTARCRQRLDALTDRLGLDRELARRWALANSVDLALWSGASGEPDDAAYLVAVALALADA